MEHHFILTCIVFTSVDLYKGDWKSSPVSSSSGAEIKLHIYNIITHQQITDIWLILPLGITPGSMNVASVKFAITKNVTMP